MNFSRKAVFLAVFLALVLALPAFAQDMMTPSVIVDGQIVVDDAVRIEQVVSADDGFIVIHNATEQGDFGDVIGYAPVSRGINYNVVVRIDSSSATDTMFAMLHTDDGVVGEYEFGTVEGADGPVIVNDQIVTPAFNAEIISANDQFVEDQVVIDSVTMSTDGWVVVHADSGNGTPGDVIGFTPVVAGTSTNIVVPLDGDATNVIYPMLHVDTGEAGEYEFGTVEGADSPVVIDGAVATKPIWTVPHMRISDQALVPGDSQALTGATLAVSSVLSDGPGFVVIHADSGDGTPGEVIGFEAIDDGLTQDIQVILSGTSTPVLFPMLHSDTGEVGTYEFGTVEGADSPVSVDGDVVVFPIDAAPAITYNGFIQDGVLTVQKAVIDADGWLVIHADSGDGSPGEVIGAKRIRQGVNFDVTVELDESMLTETVFPMLHYDTGEIGTYEFGTVEGADSPVSVNGDVVVGELTPLVYD